MSQIGGLPLLAFSLLLAKVSPVHARDIRVRLLKHATDVRLEAEHLSIDADRFEFATMTPDAKKGAWLIVSRSKKTRIPYGPIELDATNVTINHEAAPNHLQFHVRHDGGIDVIAYIALEDYLKGVIPREMPSGWPPEALKAQAIAARSFAYRRMQERQLLDFDVEASVLDQQFKFIKEPALKVRQVIAETKDMVLFDDHQSIYEALYHADCGGMTETRDNVWGGRPDRESLLDNPHHTRHWQVEMDRQSLIEKFTHYYRLDKPPNLRSLQAVGRSPSGRVKEIRVDLSEAGVKEMSSQDFRKIIGYEYLPSANFQMTWWGKILRIAGLGQGHGVGLCQLGAKVMADQGKSFREILSFYYPHTHLARITLLNSWNEP